MQRRGLYNKFNEKVGYFDYDGNNYYNIFLCGICSYDLLTFDEFWNLMDDFDLSIELNIDELA